MSRPQQPSIGRIVHYQAFGTPGGEFKSEPRAAVVTAVHPDGYNAEVETIAASLCVLNPTGMFFNQKVPFSAEPKPGHWSWPPRV